VTSLIDLSITNKEYLLHLSKKRLGRRAALLAGVALCISGSAGASMASAAGTWNEFPLNSSTPATLAGTLSLQQNGGTPVTCPVQSQPGGTAFNGGVGSAQYAGLQSLQTCSNGGQFGIRLVFTPGYSGGWGVTFASSGAQQQSPFGLVWLQINFGVPFTNGSGGVASKVTFNHKLIGYQDGLITATGTLSLTRNSGGTLTLS
jgi:hypothetical protein